MAAAAISLEAPLLVESQKRMRVDEFPYVREERWPGWPGDNVFRLLVPAHKVGAIIGRKGEFVKRMCEETKSRIKILDGVIGTAERVVLVSAREEPEALMSPAVDGLLKVHQRTLGLIEGVEGYPCATVDLECPVSSRLLVAAAQAGSLIGKQGTIIKSIQDTSGATVRLLPPEDLPPCALQDDRIVEMHGEPVKVHKAIELAVSYLRKFLVDRSVLPLFELNRAYQAQLQPQVVSQGTWVSAATPLPIANPPNLNGVSFYDTSSYQHNSLYQAPNTLEVPQQHEGVSLYGRDPSTGSVVATPIIAQVTQHMQVALAFADTIIGVGGANISSMRRVSGATITIQEAACCPGEMTIDIHGTSSEVQMAVQLIQISMAGLATPSSVSADLTAPSGAASYTSAPPNPSYISAPVNSTYNAVCSYNSNDAGGYLPNTQPAPVYSSGNVGHSTATYGSYSSCAYSY